MLKNFKKKLLYFYGCFGFMGLTGFRYFTSHDITDLCGFAFFAFFSYYFIAAIYTDKPDERYHENCKLAKVFSFNIGIIEMSLLIPAYILIPSFSSYILVFIMYIFASLVLLYSIKFYILEKR